jgi:16S rRNA (cytosine1402-N4)-methyltransferase
MVSRAELGPSGEDACHLPVLVEEVNRLLIRASTGVILDCTVGTGGHAAAMLDAAPSGCVLVGLDLDREALEVAAGRLARFGDRVILRRTNFVSMESVLAGTSHPKADAVVIDCGISHLQIVKPGRGFSFDREGPLDMRFDASQETSAASILGTTGTGELKDLLARFGQRTGAGRLARSIIEARDRGKLESTIDLAAAVKSVIKQRAAKSLARVFLALRTRVNREIESLAEALDILPRVLRPGGRAGVITYHSTEDRVVKTAFRRLSGKCVCPPDIVT